MGIITMGSLDSPQCYDKNGSYHSQMRTGLSALGRWWCRLARSAAPVTGTYVSAVPVDCGDACSPRPFPSAPICVMCAVSAIFPVCMRHRRVGHAVFVVVLRGRVCAIAGAGAIAGQCIPRGCVCTATAGT